MAGTEANGGGGGNEDGYPEKYSVYSVRYGGVSPRTLKRWVKVGKDAKDRCPLEDAKALAGWWTRHFTNKVPDGVLRAQPLLELPVAKVEKIVQVEKRAAGAPVVGEVPKEEELPVGDEELGIERTLERLERMEVRLSRKAHEPGQTKAWLETVQRMGSMQEKLRMEMERMGKLLPKDVVEDVLHSYHGPIERETRLMYRTMCEVMGLPASPEREAAWNEECDRMFLKFGEQVFK